MDWNFKFAKIVPEDLDKRDMVFDIEANNLLHKVSKIWVIAAQDYKTREFYVFSDQKTYGCPCHGGLIDGVKFLVKARSIICHNIASYDWYLLKKFYPRIWNKKSVPWKKCHDTYVQSKAQWFDRPRVKGVKGNHGLQYYGELLGYPKPPIEDWSYWDADKLNRCLVDIEINTRTLDYLNQEKAARLQSGIDFKFQTEIVKYSQFWCTQQELNGFKANKSLMESHVDVLDKSIKGLVDEIEPQLPMQLKVKNLKCTWIDIKDKWPAFFDKVPATETALAKRNGEIVNVDVKETYMPTLKYQLKADKRGIILYDVHTAKWFNIGRDPKDSDALVEGPYTKIFYEETKLTQHAQVKKFLLSLGWKPTEWTIKKDVHGDFLKNPDGSFVKGSPKLTEDSFESLPDGVGQSIATYNTLMHRRRTLTNDEDDEKGWLNQLDHNDRIRAGANVFATSTGRASQFGETLPK